MSLLCLIVLLWVPLRLLSGFKLGLLCDLPLVCAWFYWYATDSTAPVMYANWLLVPVYGVGGFAAYRLACLGLRTPPHETTSVGKTRAASMTRTTQLRLCLLAPIHEEFVWRVAVQSLLAAMMEPWLACSATAVLFTVWHRTVWRSLALTTELFLFAMLLGVGFAVTADPLLPIGLHVTRNVLVLQQPHTHVLT